MRAYFFVLFLLFFFFTRYASNNGLCVFIFIPIYFFSSRVFRSLFTRRGIFYLHFLIVTLIWMYIQYAIQTSVRDYYYNYYCTRTDQLIKEQRKKRYDKTNSPKMCIQICNNIIILMNIIGNFVFTMTFDVYTVHLRSEYHYNILLLHICNYIYISKCINTYNN